ncbi:imidazole glycerol phosphate synthase subunit HisH [Deinococcus peraridilitoris]|uniref:Imidazole glycerol phosphate synthase subunit HisH n=1 Tax=Deinococcus peraridilitoris (strain DSM 19664 / LMG 22246 / CIP 109416 / KR-200) TaxID=937777 RepID=L0A4Y7_DEIPD|nr:imidazole glycerol phosphate synthase subunit HisH [Deinococcus peraridilitoris]AFZ68926.1 imidazole glycerol phosphate synthase, glutamine amidotransferase subunit [Deinococcus peraridilitoris DSM 19664]
MGKTLLIDYGSGNLRSAHKALVRAGLDVELSSDPARVSHAAALVVPGQGHFRQVMEAFRSSGFEEPLREAVGRGVPLLGICVGMQLLFEGSEEAPGTPGLGLFGGIVRRYGGDVSVPQMGWNSIDRVGDSPILRDLACPAYVYFANSYYVPLDAEVEAGAISEHGVTSWSAISQGNIHATQFHPEKSGPVGLEILHGFRRHVVEAASLTR